MPGSSTIAELIESQIVPALGPGSPREALRTQLAALTVEKLFVGQKIVNQDAARCCLSGLWLLHDFLDESHTLSQEIETTDGAYWHAIMHRREPDYGNAKYWFRRVGRHPVFEPLAAQAHDLAMTEGKNLDPAARFLAAQTEWEPFRFIDLCELIAHGKSHAEPLARRVARIEWDLLFAHCRVLTA